MTRADENKRRTILAINEYVGKVFTAEFDAARDLAAVAMASEVHVELTPRPLARSGLARRRRGHSPAGRGEHRRHGGDDRIGDLLGEGAALSDRYACLAVEEAAQRVGEILAIAQPLPYAPHEIGMFCRNHDIDLSHPPSPRVT